MDGHKIVCLSCILRLVNFRQHQTGFKVRHIFQELSVPVGERHLHVPGVALGDIVVERIIHGGGSILCVIECTCPVFTQAQVEGLAVDFQDAVLQLVKALCIGVGFCQRTYHAAVPAYINVVPFDDLVIVPLKILDAVAHTVLAAAAFCEHGGGVQDHRALLFSLLPDVMIDHFTSTSAGFRQGTGNRGQLRGTVAGGANIVKAGDDYVLGTVNPSAFQGD